MAENVKEVFDLLMSNSPAEIMPAAKVIIKCVSNILRFPDNPKYRRLKVGSREITDRLLPVRGALECLFSVGFEEDSDYFVCPQSAPLTLLQKLFDLLNNWQSKISNAEETKADEQVVSMHPTNATPTYLTNATPAHPTNVIYSGAMVDWDTKIYPADVQRLEQNFYGRIEASMQLVQLYEDRDIQRKAKSCIPLNELHHRAQLHFDSISSGKISTKIKASAMDLRDCLLVELLFWFKNQFFAWFDVPNCPTCEATMSSRGMTAATVEELIWQAGRVESYECDSCGKLFRFPRYNHPLKLLSTRQGRCGEWANCFTLCCRALDFEARYVLDWTDHVWTEVYSASQKRWLHCDPCENTCDAPLLYESGWGKKLSYVLAFSLDDVQDVTWRYTGQHAEVSLRRHLCRESWLLNAVLMARRKLQDSLSASRKAELADRLVVELVEFMSPKNVSSEESVGRLSGSLAWRQERSEVGDTSSGKIMPAALELSTEEVVGKLFQLKYCAATDKYVRLSTQNVEVSGWQTLVCQSDGVFRKVEQDWKMAYLARAEGSTQGSLSWKLDCSNTSLKVASVAVKCCSSVFEDGCVVKSLSSGPKCLLMPQDHEVFVTDEFRGCQQIVLDVKLSGGQGSNAWQHAQLFRQSIKDKNLFPLEILIKFE